MAKTQPVLYGYKFCVPITALLMTFYYFCTMKMVDAVTR